MYKNYVYSLKAEFIFTKRGDHYAQKAEIIHKKLRLFTKTMSKCYLDEKAVSKKEYQLFLDNLWESYGQHEKQHLVKEDNHIKYLDRFSCNTERLNGYQNLFNKYNSLLIELNATKDAIDDYNKNHVFTIHTIKCKSICWHVTFVNIINQ